MKPGILLMLAFMLFLGVEGMVAFETLRVENGDFVRLSNGERIYVRTAGHGSIPVVLLSGNNTSGRIFESLLSFVRAIDEINDRYTFYAFDYRGSGMSSYHKKITSLEDFARDFDEIVQRDERLKQGGIVLVGYSMGFGVAQEMIFLAPEKYEYVISLAGMGTRGIRVPFTPENAGTDPSTGKTYQPGDWVDSLSATAFHQRSWQGENRTYERVKATWNMLVFNDILKYSISSFSPTKNDFMNSPFYEDSIRDVLSVEYMPESLFASHMFNASTETISHTNSDGTQVVIPGSGKVTAFKGKKVLLVKARTDYINWRGDLVVMDQVTQNSKYDLKQAGAHVDALIFEPDRGFDHGFPIDHSLETLKIIHAFVENGGQLDRSFLDSLLGEGNYTIYNHEEDSWEMKTYGGF
ncbi:MAG: hypothetical protein PWP37_1561 [Thermotogota bacterium]|nr:hypothetical protein [Thermotogota bacterium]MDK2865369.1 hypothetical protein [Thermotogota bacterium]